MTVEKLEQYRRETADLDAGTLVAWAIETFGRDRVVLATSFSIEDQVLTDLIVKADHAARIFTLDTGRHFQATYDLWQRTEERYKISIEPCFPEKEDIDSLYASGGPNLFYDSVDKRKQCCAARKVKPLAKKLATADAWICGLRAEQSVTRTTLEKVEWDAAFNIYKINPLATWTEAETNQYIETEKVPKSVLYTQGFRSIGCEPCTRAVAEGEDVRAGRWWWENPEHKECGLHRRPVSH